MKVQTAASTELLFAIEVSKAAGIIAMDYLRQGVTADIKEDGSPVTRADKECERLIIDRICETFPNDAIIGEEHGERKGSGTNRRWIIDPIDGTFNYARSI